MFYVFKNKTEEFLKCCRLNEKKNILQCMCYVWIFVVSWLNTLIKNEKIGIFISWIMNLNFQVKKKYCWFLLHLAMFKCYLYFFSVSSQNISVIYANIESCWLELAHCNNPWGSINVGSELGLIVVKISPTYCMEFHYTPFFHFGVFF